jgi:hypothetical protein
MSGDRCDLVFGTDDRDVGFQRLTECAAYDLGTDASGIAQRDRQPRLTIRSPGLSQPSRPSRPLLQDLIST